MYLIVRKLGGFGFINLLHLYDSAHGFRAGHAAGGRIAYSRETIPVLYTL
jgi:hypothetical protein